MTMAPDTAAEGRKRARSGPRPAQNAYLHFSHSRRAEVVKAHPGWTAQEVSAEVGRWWKSLAPAERRPWVELAQRDKERFRSEVQAQTQADVSAAEETDAAAPALPSSRKRRKRPDEPRQPDTAYTFFWKSRRAQVVAANPRLPAPLVSREVGRQWKALADTDREVWLALAEQDKLRFQREIAQYAPPPEDAPVVPPALSAIEPSTPKPARTSFQLFMSHHLESFVLLPMSRSEFQAEMRRVWKQLGDAGKAEWHELAKQDLRRYEAELEAYSPSTHRSAAALMALQCLDELKKAARGDPNAPRLPTSAYNFFLSSTRRDIQSQRPGLNYNEVKREIGVRWKALNDADRQPFAAQAEADVARFEREMEAHLLRSHKEQLGLTANSAQTAKKGSQPRKTPATVVNKATPTSRVTKGKGGKLVPPRRPQTAYNIMYMATREEVLATYQVSHNECSALCGRLWRQMTDEEREPFQRMAAAAKLRYQAELEAYRASVEEASEAPEVQQSGGFQYFVSAKRRESEGLTLEDVSAIWTAIPEQHHVLWGELAGDEEQNGDNGLEQQEEDEQRQLEENARAILAARDARFSFDESGEEEEDGRLGDENSQYEDEDDSAGNQEEHSGEVIESTSDGFANFVSHKKAERVGWTEAMWADEWAALPEKHRKLWEDLAPKRSAVVGVHQLVSSLGGSTRRLSNNSGGSSSDGGDENGDEDSDGGRASLDPDNISDLLPHSASTNEASVDPFV